MAGGSRAFDMDRRTFLGTVGVAAIGLGSGCLGGSVDADGDYDVRMSVDSFRPDGVTVTAGETVVWRNTSKQGHTVTAYEDQIPDEATYFATGGYESQTAAESAWSDRAGGRLDPNGDEFSHTFDVPGRYVYYCIPHEPRGMTGVVDVEPSD